MFSVNKKQIKESNSIEVALKGVDLLQFVFFYKQLQKLKSNRDTYHIEFVLKECYPTLSAFSLAHIEAHLKTIDF